MSDKEPETAAESLSERVSMQNKAYDDLNGSVKSFLVGVERDALTATTSDVMLAGATKPFTLSEVSRRWLKVVTKALAYAKTYLGPNDAYLQKITQRLVNSEVPYSIHKRVAESIRYAAERSISKRELETNIRAAVGTSTKYADGLSRNLATTIHSRLQQSRIENRRQKRKKWVSMHDSLTRSTHLEANGQVQLISDTFTVGGYNLEQPGDPSGPPEEIENCRCTMIGVGSTAENSDETPPEYLDEQGRRDVANQMWGKAKTEQVPESKPSRVS